jgi:hypothetical protein
MGLGVSQTLVQELLLPIEKLGALDLGVSPELLQELDPLGERQPANLLHQLGFAHGAILRTHLTSVAQGVVRVRRRPLRHKLLCAAIRVAMTRDDYEEQKQRLAEQRRALIEMAETAYQHQIRALEVVWRILSGEGSGELLPPPRPVPVPAVAPAAPIAPATPARRRLGPGELYHDILRALPGLPEPFIHSDVDGAIGYRPDRGSLHRALLELIENGFLAVHTQGLGNRPTRYRWTHAVDPATET